MKIIDRFLIVLFIFSLLISSCSEDKGNYDYDWIPDYNVKFPTLTNDSIIVQLGDILTLDPIFYDEDGQIQDIDYNEYTYKWTSLLTGKIAQDDAKFLSDKYNLNVPITLDIVNGYHTIYFQATHNKTGILYKKYFKIKVVGKFKNAYLFLTEDEDKNADIEFHGKDADGKEVSLSKYLSSLNYPYISGGAYAISFDSPNKRIWISTGSGTGWLTTPTLAFDPITNKLSTYLVPQTANSFVKMYRFGTINATASNRAYVCFTEEGGLHIINNRGMSQNYAIVNDIPVSLAPMTAAANPQKSSILWDTTNKQLVFLSMGSSAAFTPMTRCEPLTSTHGGITSGIKECLYLGGSLNTTYL